MSQVNVSLSRVLETPAASPEATHQYFARKLSVETDASDVYHDRTQGVGDFVLIDVRSAKAYEECHIPGALHLWSANISEETTGHLDKDRLIVAYCWGPACNGATKAATRLSALGFQVKEMLGGIEYWRREGYDIEGTIGSAAPIVG